MKEGLGGGLFLVDERCWTKWEGGGLLNLSLVVECGSELVHDQARNSKE